MSYYFSYYFLQKIVRLPLRSVPSVIFQTLDGIWEYSGNFEIIRKIVWVPIGKMTKFSVPILNYEVLQFKRHLISFLLHHLLFNNSN